MIRSPIIVDAGSELLFFRDVERAEAYLEAVDVRNGEYSAAYDSDGRALTLGTKIVARHVFFGLVPTKIESASLVATEADRAPQLRELLTKHVIKDEATTAPQRPLATLVTMAVERQGFTA
jgi:hypothetical protein